MNLRIPIVLLSLVGSTAIAQAAPTTAPASHVGTLSPEAVRALHARVTPSLVAVQYVWASEIRRVELVGAGVVVSADGTIATSIALMNPGLPDEQLTEFKVIVTHPDRDDEELDATFLGRDERTNLAFVRPKDANRTWTPVRFVDKTVAVGEPVLSVGIMPKDGGYRAYVTQAAVAAHLRGPVPQVLVSGPLAPVHSPVFDAAGDAVGLVAYSPNQPIMLNDPRASMVAVNTPPRTFVPASDFLQSFGDLPKAGEPLRIPYMGVRQMAGVSKDVAEYFGLANQPAVQVGDVVQGTPAFEAGLKPGMVVTRVNGQPIPRGDAADELPMILGRQIARLKVGEPITLTVLPAKGQPTRDLTIKLAERPMRANLAKRWFADDLGFAVRDLVFDDQYDLKLAENETGARVTIVRPNSAAAAAGLKGDEMITQLNARPVTGVEQFRTDYEQFRKDKPREAVVLVVKREGREDTVRVEPPQ